MGGKEAWRFFSSPRNLEAMTPPEMGFKIVSLPSETLYEGEIIQYSVKAFPGIWIPWVSEIKSLKKGESFVDDQISGPFKFWHHRHSFEETECGTVVQDLIHYSVGFGIFGELARALVVRLRPRSSSTTAVPGGAAARRRVASQACQAATPRWFLRSAAGTVVRSRRCCPRSRPAYS